MLFAPPIRVRQNLINPSSRVNFLRSHFCMFSIALRAAKHGRQQLQSPEMETRSGHGRGGGESTNHSDA